jgi:hypothetical protein
VHRCFETQSSPGCTCTRRSKFLTHSLPLYIFSRVRVLHLNRLKERTWLNSFAWQRLEWKEQSDWQLALKCNTWCFVGNEIFLGFPLFCFGHVRKHLKKTWSRTRWRRGTEFFYSLLLIFYTIYGPTGLWVSCQIELLASTYSLSVSVDWAQSRLGLQGGTGLPVALP